MPEESNVNHILVVARRYAVLVVLVAAIVGLVALVVSLLQTERYRATAKVLYTPSVLSTGAENPQRALETFVGVLQTQEVLADALPDSGFASSRELRSNLEVSSNPDADLLEVTVSATSAERAARAANAVTASFIEWRDAKQTALTNARIEFLENQLAKLAGTTSPSEVAAAADIRTQLSSAQAELAVPNPDLTVVEPAVPPAEPYSPHPFRNGVIGVLAGLVLGLAVALGRDRLDRRLRSVEDVEEIYGCPALGVVPYSELAAHGSRGAALGDYSGRSPIAEAYRTIRTNLSLFRLDEGDPHVIVVSSAVPDEGKSTATANLAIALAASGRRVLAISADAHTPTLQDYFAQEQQNGSGSSSKEQRAAEAGGPSSARSSRASGLFGMVDVLAGVVPLEKATWSAQLNGAVARPGGSLDVLTGGRQFSDPAVLYQSGAMKRLLEQATTLFDVVLVDTPPILAGGESAALAQHGDALLIVASVDRLTRNGARRAARVLQSARIAPVGLIVTGRHLDQGGYLYGYHEHT
jgi:Mrp family chromosome partitioning ATPase/capsular polysaccharide biosynthesis protein